MKLIGRSYDTGCAIALEIVGDRITSVEHENANFPPVESLPWIAPGLVDVQFNGWGGQEFSAADLTVEKVERIIEVLGPQGVTQFCPTVTTHSFDVLEHSMRTLAAACEASPTTARRVVGIHLEGPYLSPEDGPRGAHPREHCKPPDWDEFQRLQDAAGGRICILTLAPEWEGSPGFIRRAVDAGVLIAIGHTAAETDDILAAVDAGARLSTHLGNGAHGTIRRHPNYIWDQLAEDRLTASIIADGHHLPASVVKSFVRAKTPQRCILVSDVSGLAGLPPGRYDRSLCDLEILADGKIVLAGQEQYLAGASRPLGMCVTRAMRFAELDLTTAIDMASRGPLELLGREAPSLEDGSVADLVLFDLRGAAGDRPPEEIEVRATIVAGELVFGNVGS